MKLLRYKGFYGSVEASVEDDCLFGKIEFIGPLVNYEADSVRALDQAFHEAIDDYLADCKQLGREPAATHKGSLNVRIGARLHHKAAVAAKEQGVNLNEFIKLSVEQAVGR